LGFFRGKREAFEKLTEQVEVARCKRLAEGLGLGFVYLTPSLVEDKALYYITKDLAISHNCMPIKSRGEKLMVAMAKPGDPRTLSKLQLFTQCKIVPVVATPSAIRRTQIHFWGRQSCASEPDGSEVLSIAIPRQKQNLRVVALVSATPDLTGKCLGANLAAILNCEGRQVHLIDLHSNSLPLSRGVSHTALEKKEWIIFTIPIDKRSYCLSWAIRADETVVVVSPNYLQRGHDYVEAVFGRFTAIVKRRWTSSPETRIKPRVLELSVIYAQIGNLLQGFKLFHQMEKAIYDELSMREPGVDMILHYLGGILEDGRNFQEAERAGLPLTILKPHSPASRCMTHIAHSLLKPTHARDPRICLRTGFGSRFLAWCRRQRNSLAKVSND
jgi:hypothetical protein